MRRLARFIYLTALLAPAALVGGLACADDQPTGKTVVATVIVTSTTSSTGSGGTSTDTYANLPLWIVADDPDASVSGLYKSPDDPYVLLAFFQDGDCASSDMDSFGMAGFEVDLDQGTIDAGNTGFFYISEEPGVLKDDQGSAWTRQSSISGAEPLDPETEALIQQANKIMEEQDRLEQINDERLDRLDELASKIEAGLSDSEYDQVWGEYEQMVEKVLDEKSLTTEQLNRLKAISDRAHAAVMRSLDELPGGTPPVPAKVTPQDVAGEYVGPYVGGAGPDCVSLDAMGGFTQGYGLAYDEDYFTIDPDAMLLITGGSGTWKVASDFGSITNEQGVVYQRGECPEDIYRAF